MLPGRGVTIRRLRVPSGRATARPTASIRLDPAATLVVRRLRGGPVLDDALDLAAREADRPALRPVGAAAQAVLFADRAELLAALAADLRDGQLTHRWWWTVLFGRLDPVHEVARAWLGHPEAVPGALDLLASRGRVARVVTVLEPPIAGRITAAVLRVFGIVEPAPDPSSVPWWRAVPEATATGLAPEQRLLLAVGLGLRRIPAEVRAALAHPPPAVPQAMVEPARDRRASSAATRPDPFATKAIDRPARAPTPALPDKPPVVTPHLVAPQRVPDPPPAPPNASIRPREHRRELAEEPDPVRNAVHARQPTASRTAGSPASVATEPNAANETINPTSPGALPRRTGVRPDPVSSTEAEPALPTRVHSRTETQLGGLFFLVPLAQDLGLYGDFTTPADAGIPLDLWDFLTLLGHELLRPAPEDPVWRLLADLAGRAPDEPPGATFDPPPWRIPPTWLTPFAGTEPWLWSAARGVLRVDHPAGFPVLAVPRTGERAQLAGELAGYRAPAVCRRRLRALPRRPLAAWVAALGRYLRPRCALALGCEPAEVAGLLLGRPALVRITPMTLEVSFSLADHPLPIRVAGLDRDPGWVPAAGRRITFQFD